MPLSRIETGPLLLLDQAFDLLERPYKTTCRWDFVEKDNCYLFSMDLPGVSKDDINIEIEQSRLKVSGERKDREYIGKKSGKFERSMELPADIDKDKIVAHCENGVLTVALPTLKKAQPRKVQISDNKTGGVWNPCKTKNRDSGS